MKVRVVLVSTRVVEAEARSPVVHDKRDALEAERLDEAFDVPRVVKEAVLDVRLGHHAEDRPPPQDPALTHAVRQASRERSAH